MEILYNKKIFKSYDDNYFVDCDGNIYSKYKKGLLKHYIDKDGYHRVDIHKKHIKNNYKNLYLGTQKQNMQDCIKNNHRIGNTCYIKILDKQKNKVLEFYSIKDFLDYTGHKISNGSIVHCKDKKWFKENYKIIEKRNVTTIENTSKLGSE